MPNIVCCMMLTFLSLLPLYISIYIIYNYSCMHACMYVYIQVYLLCRASITERLLISPPLTLLFVQSTHAFHYAYRRLVGPYIEVCLQFIFASFCFSCIPFLLSRFFNIYIYNCFILIGLKQMVGPISCLRFFSPSMHYESFSWFSVSRHVLISTFALLQLPFR